MNGVRVTLATGQGVKDFPAASGWSKLADGGLAIIDGSRGSARLAAGAWVDVDYMPDAQRTPRRLPREA